MRKIIAWEQRKLGDILKVNSGKDYKHLENGEIPVYGTGGFMLFVNDRLSDNDAIGIGRKGTIDKPQLLKAPFWTVDTLFYMTPQDFSDLYFCYSLVCKINWKKYDESTGVPSLSKLTIENVTTRNPSIEEQIKIGKLFSQLNNTIALHQEKLDKLYQLKNGYLQVKFPEKGEMTPKIRFTAFNDKWEQRRLKEIANSFSGGTPNVGNQFYYGGNIPFIRSAEINSKSTELFITSDGYNNSSAKMVETGDILYALYGATSGEVGISKIHGAINQAILAIKPKLGYNSDFITQWLKNQKETIINTYLQGGQGNLSGSIVKELTLLLPTHKEEQVKIGKFFNQLDNTIALHQKKLDKLQKIKKAYLQKLFI